MAIQLLYEVQRTMARNFYLAYQFKTVQKHLKQVMKIISLVENNARPVGLGYSAS